MAAEDRLMYSTGYETALMSLGVVALVVILGLLVVFGAEWAGLGWTDHEKKENGMRFAKPEGVYHIEPMPSQVQVAICHGFYVREELRGQGLAKRLHVQQIMDMELMGYDYALCTVTGDNVPQRKALEATGWTKLSEFRNSRVGQITQTWGRPINAKTIQLPAIHESEAEHV
jgi:GNAT superfamily N-acetyltransferase